jgi:HEAT repeat protein/ATP/ADP translocase
MSRVRLLALLSGCRPDEAALLGRLWLLAFCLGLTMALFRTAAEALYLGEFGKAGLPSAYLASVGLSAVLVIGFGQLQARVSWLSAFTALVGVFLVSVALVSLSLLLGLGAPAIAAGRYVGGAIYLLGALGFWPVATSLLDIRQGKRLFGFLGSAEALAEILGGLAAAWVAPALDVTYLVDGALVTLAAALAIALLSLPAHARATPSQAAVAARRVVRGLSGVIRSPYLLLILGGFALATVCMYLLDYAFLAGLSARSQTPGELASWLGPFYATAAGLSLFAQTMIAPRLLDRVGVRHVLLLLPLTLLASVVAYVACNLTGAAAIAFAVVVLTKLAERVLTRGVQVPTTRVLYQAVPASQRPGFQATVEAIGIAVAGLASGALMLAGPFTEAGSGGILLALAIAVVAWVGLSLALGRVYLAHLQARLAHRHLIGTGLIADASARAVLAGWLQREDLGDVLQALQYASTLSPDTILTDAYGRLLTHPSAEVRREAVQRLAASHNAVWLEQVRRLVHQDPAQEVRAAAVLALAALDQEQALEPLLELADGPDETLARAALVGLLREGGMEGVMTAAPRLMALVGSQDPQERVRAATILGEAGLASYHRPLLTLLRDAEPQVRRAALQASGTMGHVTLWPAACEQLARPELRMTAVRALLRGGPEALPAVKAAAEREESDAATRLLLVRLAWRLGGQRAIPVLQRWTSAPGLRVRVEALEALIRLGHTPVPPEQESLRQKVDEELRVATELVAVAAALGDAGGALARALRLEWRWRARAVLARLDLLEPSRGLRDIRRRLRAAWGERGLALEGLEVLLPSPLGRALVTLLEERPDLERLAPWATPPQASLAGRLRALWTGGEISAWTRACLLHEAGQSVRGELRDLVERGLQDASPLVRETATWAAAK